MKVGLRNQYTITLDDDPTISQIIESATGIRSFSFASTQELFAKTSRYRPIAAFIDLNIQKANDGLDCIPELVRRWPYCPIIVISANISEEAVSEALAMGAVDFVAKPIRPKELQARFQIRIAESMRRQELRRITFGDVVLDLEVKKLEGQEKQVPLSPSATLLLRELIEARGTIVPKEKLKNQVWKNVFTSDNSLNRKVYEVRQALAGVSSLVQIRSIYGKGFLVELRDGAPELGEFPIDETMGEV